MDIVNSLKDIIEFDNNFRNSINLYLNLNKKEKVLSYIPTQSSVRILTDYLNAVYRNKEQATLLIGPYGKGKSHLLLVLLSIISMERNEENSKIIEQLINKIYNLEEIGQESVDTIEQIWNEKNRFLPVIITDSRGDLHQSFLYALHEALKREGCEDLVPDTYYSIAVDRILDWKQNYSDTYEQFKDKLRKYNKNIEDIVTGLKQYSKTELEIFSSIYPEITSGSKFNPMAVSDVLPLFKSVSEKLYEQNGFDGIYIVFDEFSKFIEGQDRLYTGNNMKLLQDMCELATDSNTIQIFITMVAHKSIKEYGNYLSTEIINSFMGIEGRLEEKYFITSFKNNYELIQNAIKKKKENLNHIPQCQSYLSINSKEKYYQLPPFKINFSIEDFEKIILKGCYPLSPVSAYLLLNISEKVAQNERTLFTFISKDEQYSMARFVSEHTKKKPWIIEADLIYDYFSGLFKKDVANEFIHNEWLNAEYAISKCDREDERKVLKTLAIILIVNREDELPATNEILSLASGISDGTKVIEQLAEQQLIYKKGSTNCYVFKTRAGSALKMEIKKRREMKGDIINISKVCMQVTDKYFVIPKKYNMDFMMTRYFRHEYMNVDDFLNIQNSEVYFNSKETSDGKIFSLYSLNERNYIEEIKDKLLIYKNPKLIVISSPSPFKLIKEAKDYEIVQELKENRTFIDDNEVLKRELPLLEEDLSKVLTYHIRELFEENKQGNILFYNGKKVEVFGCDKEEMAVNQCCEIVYRKTPIINNEMINRRVIYTGQTKRARKKIIEVILTHKDDETFYSGSNQEATIYRSLFKVTNILEGKPEKSIQEILEVIHEFINSCSDKKRALAILIEKLVSEPYGMREGVIPVYLAYILSQRKEDIVVYFSKMEIQITADIIINMCENPNDYLLYVSKEDIEKEKYIKNLQELFHVNENLNLTDSRINNILICMQRWFRGLPQISRNIGDVDSYQEAQEVAGYLQKVRELLLKADANSYEIIFEKFPKIFGQIDNLETVFLMLAQCKKVFDNYYDWIVHKTIHATYEVFGKKQNEDLHHVLKEWYEKQSNMSQRGLNNGRLTNFMTCIERINIYDDIEITKKLVKAVMDIYLENWNEFSFDKYIESLNALKLEAESIKNHSNEGELKLSFTDKNGQEIERFYNQIDENVGSVLRNILEDTLEEFNDLGVNDRVAILLEMIEKIIE